MCAALRHPHIVSVLDFGIDASVGSYLVMEHLNGPSLVQQLRTNGPLPVSEVCRVASHVATALDLAHSRGIVHRDLKPANIMTHRYETGEVVYKIIDFGIGNLQAQDAPTTNLGDAARFSATLAYASPEQLNGSAVDGRADIYSLGATVYELLTGRPPFVDADLSSLITKQYLTVPPPPSSTGVEVTPAIDAAVLKALEKNPGERWATARWVIASRCALFAGGSAETGTGPRPASCARRTRPRCRIRQSCRCATTAKNATWCTS